MALRIGYIGAGSFSNGFIYPQLQQHEVELAAVCDLIEEKAAAAARKFGFQKVYTDFEKMCDEEQLDAVFCVGGPQVHYSVGMQVLERGLPLYVQKPPAPTPEQTREMAQQADQQGLVCHVGFNFRSSPAVSMTKELITGTEFGPPTLMIYRYGLVSGQTWRDAIHDQHCHATDTIRYLMGEVDSMHVEPLIAEGVRGYAACMKMRNGAIVTLNTTSEQDIHGEFVYFEVTGRNKHYVISHDGDLRYHRPEGADICLTKGSFVVNRILEWWGYIEDVGNFLAAVRGEETDRCPIGDTVKTMELCEEIYRQCRERGAPE